LGQLKSDLPSGWRARLEINYHQARPISLAGTVHKDAVQAEQLIARHILISVPVALAREKLLEKLLDDQRHNADSVHSSNPMLLNYDLLWD
jgi:hypothetical protein